MEASILLPLIGIGILVAMGGFGVVWVIVARRRQRTWTRTQGVIVGAESRVSTTSNGVSGTSKALIIEWRDAEGIVRRYSENFSMGRLRVPVGKAVPLYVYPGNPRRATRALVAPGVMFGTLGVVIGAAFTAISLVATR